jgi:hypothetical protein
MISTNKTQTQEKKSLANPVYMILDLFLGCSSSVTPGRQAGWFYRYSIIDTFFFFVAPFSLVPFFFLDACMTVQVLDDLIYL